MLRHVGKQVNAVTFPICSFDKLGDSFPYSTLYNIYILYVNMHYLFSNFADKKNHIFDR